MGTVTFYVSQTLSCGEGPRAAIVVNVNAVPNAPTVATPVVYCQNATTIALTATGTNLLWYTAATGGTGINNAPLPSTTAVGSTLYYVSQSINGCESPRASITVTVNAIPAAPTVASPVTYCQNATAVPLIASGTNLKWYTVPSGGTAATSAPIPSTANPGTITYYVSQTTTGCESPRAAINVVVNPLATAPAVSGAVSYCQNTTAVALTATGSNLLWYSNATGGTGSSTAPIPSTTTAGTITYYVSQSNSCGEGARAAIAVTITATPAAPTSLSASNITATSANLSWQGAANSFYTVEIRPTGSTNWTTIASGITANAVSATGLTADLDYEWRVSANCAAASSNNYITGTFRTLPNQTNNLTVRNGIGINLSPNPLLDRAKITYSLTVSGKVTIGVYTATGQLRTILYSADQGAGTHSFDITNQLNNLSSQTYFLKVEQLGKTNVITFLKQ